MDSNKVNVSQLDQLELMVNQVLEQTGHIFAQAAKSQSPSTIANGARLTRIVPQAMNGFNEALDELQQELTIARAVLRRDYAAFQAQQAQQTIQADAPSENLSIKPTANDADVQMSEAPTAAETPDQTDIQVPTPPQQDPSPQLKDSQKQRPTLETDIPPPETAQKTDQDPPTTGALSAIDFDSLFNDTNSNPNTTNNSPSNSPSKESEPVTAQVSPPPPKGDSQDFSFETFNSQNLTNADNDNDNDNGDITSLLPGLEPYANADNDNDGEPDFSMLDDFIDTADKPSENPVSNGVNGSVPTITLPGAGGGGGGGDASSVANGANVGAGGEQRETIFDDLMNFDDFDMSALDAGDGNFEDGGNRFDESFFDLS